MSPFRSFTIFLIFLLSFFEAFSQASVDNPYDTDGDGLIEVHTVEQLSVIRCDLDGDGEIDDLDSDNLSDRDSKAFIYVRAFGYGVCPPDEATHRGYELAAALDFAGTRWALDATADGIADAVAEGWDPIGQSGGITYRSTFEGNGHTITGLYINRPNTDSVGLFSQTGAGAIIRGVGLEEVSVHGDSYVGGLVGFDGSNIITSSYAKGTVRGDSGRVGGLVGYNLSGPITSSYATGTVRGKSEHVGGLVGYSNGPITSSYATGSVMSTGDNVGGLVGRTFGAITSSYATGDVAGGTWVGGLVGRTYDPITSSYATGDVSGNEQCRGLGGGD